MFESDDFDQILSQLDFPVASSSDGPAEQRERSANLSHKNTEPTNNTNRSEVDTLTEFSVKLQDIPNESTNTSSPFVAPIQNSIRESPPSLKHTKRKIIDSYFDHKSKRKFPGPAGLLNGSFKENKDEVVCQMELLSQDVDFTQNCLQKDAFDSPLWQRLQADMKDWNLGTVDTTKAIKQSCITGNLRKRKAHTVAAFIESVDRSITDPLVTIRDFTGSIKCTLHRDAWSKFSPYIVSEYCAVVLWKPTILTTGSAFKKYYLNITLSNIFAVYSSAVLDNDTNIELPDGYVKIYEGDFTVIKSNESNAFNLGLNSTVDSVPEENGLFEGLDNFFTDDIF